jgi:putative hydrolase
MDPQPALDAIDRITYLLDRDLAPTQKVRAFRNAAGIISELPPDELGDRVEANTLEELEGIGKSTGQAIRQALQGKTPTYLTKLEETSTIEVGEGAELRAALRGDCHTHSDWSDGGAPIETMARTAIGLGHDYMVLTDHSARLTIAHGLDEDRLRQQLDVIDGLNEKLAPFRILSGMEVDILEDGRLDLGDEMLARLDVVVASLHSKLRMERQAMTRRMVVAMASPHTDILGHCTGRKLSSDGVMPSADAPLKRQPSTFDAEIVFAACKQFDKAVEINCRPERQDPPDELLELALDFECQVSIDTDAHAPGQLEWQVYGCDKAARHGIEAEQIVNTWPADDLVEWAGTHSGI